MRTISPEKVVSVVISPMVQSDNWDINEAVIESGISCVLWNYNKHGVFAKHDQSLNWVKILSAIHYKNWSNFAWRGLGRKYSYKKTHGMDPQKREDYDKEVKYLPTTQLNIATIAGIHQVCL